MSNNQIKEYEKTMLLATPSAVQLCDLTKSMILNTPYLMAESSVHIAIEYFKASFKRNIELDQKLSESEKENQKKTIDAFCYVGEENFKNQLLKQGRLITKV